MKKILVIGSIILFSGLARAQENMITFSGGYAFANIEDTEENATGWRISGLYEYNPLGGILAHGVEFGYIHVSAIDGTGLQETTSTVNLFPLYYAPKVMLGNEKIKGFIKGVLGMQFAALKREGFWEIKDNDFGFYGGGGGGLMFFIKENIFVNAEYEIAWASNGFYKDGWVNSITGGIGFRF
jgi:hypothetical protein